MSRRIKNNQFINHPILLNTGITKEVIRQSIEYTYSILDAIDDTLSRNNEPRLAELLELANLSAILGNLFRGGVAKFANNNFQANAPHKYPDLIALDSAYEDVEIKVALETNKPKGHLIKPGLHLTLRYVLGDANGNFTLGKERRGNVVWFWEVRFGYLLAEHFSVSNTRGDSGKTAVINADGMKALNLVFCDLEKVPYSKRGRVYKLLQEQLMKNNT